MIREKMCFAEKQEMRKTKTTRVAKLKVPRQKKSGRKPEKVRVKR